MSAAQVRAELERRWRDGGCVSPHRLLAWDLITGRNAWTGELFAYITFRR